MSDKVLEELWRIKDDMAREYGYDVLRLVAALRAAQADEGHRVVDLQASRTARERGASARPHRLPANGPAS